MTVSRGAEVQGSRGAGEQRCRGAEVQGSRGAITTNNQQPSSRSVAPRLPFNVYC
ncbi:hypothetical protein H6G17_03225 [Chroococcidiopsis sp. FACHB-1243]|uniref:hypothetical protein n=1 Tax=Chroococcidiopsis sp. [FACHB-1243] TaxID=2692781 RepID=UPI00178578BD|nr:hypothetical protein [Chroococcidiopsis sp. [FACHB-1243]]MBD2304530.1 hypothetical protein [Chroococcidiopsis sp. [FACHB-1243]]